jgi:hypothetical protein
MFRGTINFLSHRSRESYKESRAKEEVSSLESPRLLVRAGIRPLSRRFLYPGVMGTHRKGFSFYIR